MDVSAISQSKSSLAFTLIWLAKNPLDRNIILANQQKGDLFKPNNWKGDCLNQWTKIEWKGGKDMIGCGQMQGISVNGQILLK